MAKRNKKNHKHWIPCRRSTSKYIIGIDPADKASDPLVIQINGKLKTIVLVREDAYKIYLDYIDYWNKNMEQLFGLPAQLDGRKLPTVERVTLTDEVGKYFNRSM